MEPLSVATGCVSLLTGVSKLSIQISAFVSSVRDARKDMAAVTGELSSLSLCLETLRDDSMKLEYPDGFRENLLTVLKNCDAVTTEMTALLDKLSSANLLRKVQWTVMGRDDMNKLRSSLESHKSALEIGLDMTSFHIFLLLFKLPYELETARGSLDDANVGDAWADPFSNNRLLISAVKEDVADVKADTAQIPSIKQDTAQIEGLVQQIGLLRLQLDSGPMNDAKARHLEMFLDQSTSYAETVIDAIEDEEYHVQPPEGLVSELSNNNRDFDTANVNATNSNHDIPLHTGSRLSTSKSTSDQSGTLKNTIEDEESYVQSSRNSLSRRSSDNWDIPTTGAGAAGGYHDSGTRASGQLPAIGDIPGQTIATTGASSLSATAEADKNSRQQALAKPRTTLPDSPYKMLLLPSRDQDKIQKANALRNGMALAEQQTLNEALEVAIRGKKSLIDRLGFNRAWLSKDTGSYDEIEDLLDRGADPNYNSFGVSFCTVEMSNARRGEVLRLLLLRGASFSLFSSDKWLGMAARSGWTTLVENFLDSGSSLRARDQALVNAASACHNDTVKMLLEHGTSSVSQSGKDAAVKGAAAKDVAAKEAAANDAKAIRRFDTLLEHSASASHRILLEAASAGREDILKVLLDRGLSANVKFNELTALDEAIRNGHLKAVNLLLEHGAVVNAATMNRYNYPINNCTQAERNEIRALLRRYFNQQMRSGSYKLQ